MAEYGQIDQFGHIDPVGPHLATFGHIWPLLEARQGHGFTRLGRQGP